MTLHPSDEEWCGENGLSGQRALVEGGYPSEPRLSPSQRATDDGSPVGVLLKPEIDCIL